MIVSRYKLDSNGNDSGPNSINLSTGTGSYIPGRFGYGNNINGTASRVTYSTTCTRSPSLTTTVSVWFKNSSMGTNGKYAQLWEIYSTAAGEYCRWGLLAYYASVSTQIVQIQRQKINVGAVSTTSYTWSPGTSVYHNYVATYNSSTGVFNLYIDGKFISTGTQTGVGTGTDANSYNQTTMGARYYLSVSGFDTSQVPGILDECIIDSREWTASDVRNYYAQSLGQRSPTITL